MAKPKSTPKPKRSWRDTPDSSHTNRLTAWPSPESLHPTEATMFSAIMGDESARAIIRSFATYVHSYPTEVSQ